MNRSLLEVLAANDNVSVAEAASRAGDAYQWAAAEYLAGFRPVTPKRAGLLERRAIERLQRAYDAAPGRPDARLPGYVWDKYFGFEFESDLAGGSVTDHVQTRPVWNFYACEVSQSDYS